MDNIIIPFFMGAPRALYANYFYVHFNNDVFAYFHEWNCSIVINFMHLWEIVTIILEKLYDVKY